MAKKPTRPDPADLPPEPDDAFPADAFDLSDDQSVEAPVPVEITDAEVITDADLFDFSEPVTEPIQTVPPVPAGGEPSGEDDILAWEETADTPSGSFVGKRTVASDSSILSLDIEPTSPQSGWLDSAVGLDAAPESGTPMVPPADTSLSASGVNLHDPELRESASDSGSSIFGRKAVDESSQVELELPRLTPSDSGVQGRAPADSDVGEAVPIDAASIWDESDAVDAARLAADRDDDAQAIGWEISDEDARPQSTLRAPRPDLDEDDELSNWLAAEAREARTPAPTPRPTSSPVSDSTGVGMPVTPQTTKRPSPSPSPIPIPDLESADDDYVEPKRPTPKPAAKKGAAGWIGGGLAGLLVGAGGVFGLSQMGILPGGDSKPTAQQPGPGPANPGPVNPPAMLTPEQGIAALDRGDAAAAKKALEALPADTLTAATRATRGHARLLARVQELADTGAAVKADDKALVDAETDLTAVFEKAADLKTPDEQAAAVRAALNLGLLKELAGDVAGATKVYTAAAAAVPAGKRDFETALKRLKLTAPAAPGKTSRLDPRQGEQLLLAVAVLLQGDPAPAKGEKGDGEPGHLFWDAANAAAADDFTAAAKLVAQAKAAHEARRLKLVGRGTNPKSDPAEQIFLSTCDQLKELYTLKATLYGHPVAGPLAKIDGAAKALDKLADAQEKFAKADADRLKATQDFLTAEAARKEAAGELATATTKLKTATDDLTKAMTDLAAVKKVADARDQTLAGVVKELKAAKLIPDDADQAAALAKIPDIARQAAGGGDAKKLVDMLAAAKKDYDASQAALKTATEDVAKAKAEVTAAMKLADDRAKELTDVQKKAKTNDDVLAGLVKEFKTAKLIPADADAATALANLPDAAKKAASAAASGDAVKAAEALLAVKKDLDAAQTSLKKAETDLTAAKKEATDALVRAMNEADGKAAALKMVDAVKADAAKALKEAQDATAKATKAATDADKAAKAALDAENTAKKALDEAKTALDRAKADADARAAAAEKKAVADAAEKLKAAEGFAARANDAAKKALADRDTAEAKLATAQADFARQLASIRSGGGIAGTVTPAEVIANEKADAAYSAGLRCYFAGRYVDAEKEFRAATAVADARYHYFLGLALLAQTKDAAASFRTGYDLERRNMPSARDIGEALERVQGPARAQLAAYRR